MHLLVLGQSNVANHGLGPLASAVGRAHQQGAFLPLSDPVPGGTGRGGSVWTRLAPLLKERGLADELVVTLRAEAMTEVADWSEGGRCCAALEADLPALAECPTPVTHVIYHQGERDTLLGTSSEDYSHRLLSLNRLVSAALPDARWIVCLASHRMGVVSEEVRRGQRLAIGRIPGCMSGPDTDRLGPELRYDDTHFNEAGLAAFARDLADCLMS